MGGGASPHCLFIIPFYVSASFLRKQKGLVAGGWVGGPARGQGKSGLLTFVGTDCLVGPRANQTSHTPSLFSPCKLHAAYMEKMASP